MIIEGNVHRRQRGGVVSASDSQSSGPGPGSESRSDHYLALFLGSPEFKTSAMLVNSQLFASGQFVFLTMLCLFELFVFRCLLVSTSLCANNTAEGK